MLNSRGFEVEDVQCMLCLEWFEVAINDPHRPKECPGCVERAAANKEAQEVIMSDEFLETTLIEIGCDEIPQFA